MEGFPQKARRTSALSGPGDDGGRVRRRRAIVCLAQLLGGLLRRLAVPKGQSFADAGAVVVVRHDGDVLGDRLPRVSHAPGVADSTFAGVGDAVEVLVGDEVVGEDIGVLVQSLAVIWFIRPRRLIHTGQSDTLGSFFS